MSKVGWASPTNKSGMLGLSTQPTPCPLSTGYLKNEFQVACPFAGCRVCAECTHAAGITRATWRNGQRRARLRRTPYTPPTAADKSDEERLPEFQVAFALQTSAAV